MQNLKQKLNNITDQHRTPMSMAGDSKGAATSPGPSTDGLRLNPVVTPQSNIGQYSSDLLP